MEHEAPAVFAALEQSGFAAAIRQSVWAYPAANVGHIVALFVFAGAIAVMDLRLAGAFPAMAPGLLIARARGVAMLAFLGLAGTGLLLFSAEASHIIQNPVFLTKLGLIGLGLVNVAAYEFGPRRQIAALPAGMPMPFRARATGIASLAIWLVVAALGRTIAYF